MRRRPFTVVSSNVSTDTVACLESWLDDAKAGRLIGLVATTIHQERRVRRHLCGEAARSPMFALSCASTLLNKVNRIVERDDHDDD